LLARVGVVDIKEVIAVGMENLSTSIVLGKVLTKTFRDRQYCMMFVSISGSFRS